MKPATYWVVLALIFSSCQTTNPPPAPISSDTPVITATLRQPTQTIEATATAIPETVEQIQMRLAGVVVASGWNPNNETTWLTPGGMSEADVAFLAQMQAINADPNTKTKEQLVSYDAFLTLMRKEQLARDLYSPDSTVQANTTAALDKFLASGFLVTPPTQEQVVLMKVSQTDFAGWLETLSPEQIFHLERMYCNENGIELMPSHVELWRMVDQFAQATRDGKIQYASNVAINGTKIGNSDEYNGMWMSRSYIENNKSDIFEHQITMFGEQHRWVGIWDADEHRLFTGAAIVLPYDKHGIAGEIVGSDGKTYYMPFIVSYDGGSIYGYTDHRLSNELNVDLSVAGAYFSTRLQPDYDDESYQDLTLGDILDAAKRRATFIMRSWGVTFPNGSISYMFFDKETGLPIFGTSNMEPSYTRSAIYILP